VRHGAWALGAWLAVYCMPLSAAQFPAYEQVRAQYASSDILVLDRQGQAVARVRHDLQARRGDWLALDDISIALQRAVIMSEDRRFYAHGGVDWQAMAAAAWSNVVHDRRRGASTLSMQLLALMDQDYRREPGGRGMVQKFDQAVGAQSLDAQWTKANILEAYLNLAAFRGELVGVDALSRVMFQKRASALNLREAALAAAMLRGPNVSEVLLAKRACALLREMGVPQACLGLREFAEVVLRRGSYPLVGTPGIAPHFAQLALADLLAPPRVGARVATSLDASLQRLAVAAVQARLHALGDANVRDAAVVAMDNLTGEVLAYVGSSGAMSDAGQVDHARALRQAGSALKPFLYAQAIGQQRITAASLLEDSPLNLSTGAGLYIPRNYDAHFAGWVSVRTALAASLNIPAVRTLMMVTPDAFARRLVALGLPLTHHGDYYGYSLALGSADVTLLTLTNAYRALANLGDFSLPRYRAQAGGQDDVFAHRQVGTPGEAWIVGDILSDRQARARTFGLDSPLSTPFWTAVKTGTSKDMRDNWCIGWSSRYTVGVWVGNSGGASMRDVSGVSGAGPIWHDVMAALHRHQRSDQRGPPASVTRQPVTFEERLEPSRIEAFVGDTAVSRVALAERASASGPAYVRIEQPADGALLALDPDIPPARQWLRLQARAETGGDTGRLLWRVNGRVIGEGTSARWQPTPGSHRVELADAAGRRLDVVQITIRGLPGTVRADSIDEMTFDAIHSNFVE